MWVWLIIDLYESLIFPDPNLFVQDPNDPSTFPRYPNPYIGALPNDSRNFSSNSATNLNYSTNSGSPHQVNPTITGNSLRAQVHARTQYTGVPELW